jgi:hypothetical protein
MATEYLAGLTAKQLRALLDYNPDTGLFRWKTGIDHWRAGLPAGTESRTGGGKGKRPYLVIGIGTTSRKRYSYIGIRKKVYRAHRLAWLYVHGEWPDREVDHINGNGCDNRIANLRLATSIENACNRGLRSNNTSGFKGVSWVKRAKKWGVHCGVNGITYHIGNFDSLSEARAAYVEAAHRLHGTFARIE